MNKYIVLLPQRNTKALSVMARNELSHSDSISLQPSVTI